MKRIKRSVGILLAALMMLSCIFGGCSSGKEEGIKDEVIKQANKTFADLNALSSDFHKDVDALHTLAQDKKATETDTKVALAVSNYCSAFWEVMVYDGLDNYSRIDPDFEENFTYVTTQILSEDDQMVLYDKGEKVIDKVYELTAQWFEAPFGSGGP